MLQTEKKMHIHTKMMTNSLIFYYVPKRTTSLLLHSGAYDYDFLFSVELKIIAQY